MTATPPPPFYSDTFQSTTCALPVSPPPPSASTVHAASGRFMSHHMQAFGAAVHEFAQSARAHAEAAAGLVRELTMMRNPGVRAFLVAVFASLQRMALPILHVEDMASERDALKRAIGAVAVQLARSSASTAAPLSPSDAADQIFKNLKAYGMGAIIVHRAYPFEFRPHSARSRSEPAVIDAPWMRLHALGADAATTARSLVTASGDAVQAVEVLRTDTRGRLRAELVRATLGAPRELVVSELAAQGFSITAYEVALVLSGYVSYADRERVLRRWLPLIADSPTALLVTLLTSDDSTAHVDDMRAFVCTVPAHQVTDHVLEALLVHGADVGSMQLVEYGLSIVGERAEAVAALVAPRMGRRMTKNPRMMLTNKAWARVARVLQLDAARAQ